MHRRSCSLSTILLLAGLSSLACNNRAVVIGVEGDASVAPDMGVDPDGPPPDQPPPDQLVLPDFALPDAPGPSAPCKDRSATNPGGMSKLTYRQSAAGDWKLALDAYGQLTTVALPPGSAGKSGAAVDYASWNVAGLLAVAPTPTTEAAVKDAWQALAGRLEQALGKAGQVTVRASGTYRPTHDKFPALVETVLDVTTAQPIRVSDLRDLILGAAMGEPSPGNLPAAWGPSGSAFVVRLTTVRRFKRRTHPSTGAPVLDKDGYAQDAGDKDRWQTVVLGAVNLLGEDRNAQGGVASAARDLAAGTARARYGAPVSAGGDTQTIDMSPKADIIWIMDESGSMDDNRADIESHAAALFNKARLWDVDFRMGVTGVVDPNGAYAAQMGKLCSVASTNPAHDGGTDRFLGPSERTAFEGCIHNPPGQVKGAEFGLYGALAAVKNHLPRAANRADRIRTGAKLVLIFATDEIPNSLNGVLSFLDLSSCSLDAFVRSKLDKAILPYLDYFSGKTDPQARATVHAITGLCNNTCQADVAHGYRELVQVTGGQLGDVCQSKLDKTLDAIMDQIIGEVSPIKLAHTPISASLAVSIDGKYVPRSDVKGWQYRPGTDSIVLVNIPYTKGMKVTVGYRYFR